MRTTKRSKLFVLDKLEGEIDKKGIRRSVCLDVVGSFNFARTNKLNIFGGDRPSKRIYVNFAKTFLPM